MAGGAPGFAPGVAPGVAPGGVAPGAALGHALGAAGVAGLVRHLSVGSLLALFGVDMPLFSSVRPSAEPRRAAASVTSGPCANACATVFMRRAIAAAWAIAAARAMAAFPAPRLPWHRVI